MKKKAKRLIVHFAPADSVGNVFRYTECGIGTDEEIDTCDRLRTTCKKCLKSLAKKETDRKARYLKLIGINEPICDNDMLRFVQSILYRHDQALQQMKAKTVMAQDMIQKEQEETRRASGIIRELFKLQFPPKQFE